MIHNILFPSSYIENTMRRKIIHLDRGERVPLTLSLSLPHPNPEPKEENEREIKEGEGNVDGNTQNESNNQPNKRGIRDMSLKRFYKLTPAEQQRILDFDFQVWVDCSTRYVLKVHEKAGKPWLALR